MVPDTQRLYLRHLRRVTVQFRIGPLSESLLKAPLVPICAVSAVDEDDNTTDANFPLATSMASTGIWWVSWEVLDDSSRVLLLR